jgi:hypothetical protein
MDQWQELDVVSKPPAARRKPKASTEASTKKLSNAYPEPKVLHFLFYYSTARYSPGTKQYRKADAQ